MTLQMVTCPLCCQPGFNTPDALCTALVDSYKRNLACPICNEVVTGLDKLTIHLFGHNSHNDKPAALHSAPAHSNKATLSPFKESSYARNGNTTSPVLYFQSDSGQLFAVATSAILSQFGAVTFNTQNYYSNTNVANQSGAGLTINNPQIPVSNKEAPKPEFASCKDLLTSGDFTVAQDEQESEPSSRSAETCSNKLPNVLQIQNKNSLGDCDSPGDPKPPFTCALCDLQFSNKAILAVHKQLLHKNHEEVGTDDGHKSDKSKKKPLNCNWCSATFNLKSSLLIHVKVTHPGVKDNLDSQKKEQERLNCQICGKSFQKEGALHQHMKSTHGEKPWLCTVCSKRFTTKYFLRKHKRIHTGETPYECTICHKVFTFQQSYHKHMLYHTDDKPYCCSHCGRLFKELSTLNNHERIHSGEKPFTCENCGKSFRQRVSYLVHRRIHTGAMPYKCTACDKSFRYKISQRTHKCPVQPPGVVVKTSVSLVDRLQAVMKQEQDSPQFQNERASASSLHVSSEGDNCAISEKIESSLDAPVTEDHCANELGRNKVNSIVNGESPDDLKNAYPDVVHSPSDLNLNELLFGRANGSVESADQLYQDADTSPSECLDRLHISSSDCPSQRFSSNHQNLSFDTMEDLDLCNLLFDIS